MNNTKIKNRKSFKSLCKRYIDAIKITPEPDKTKLKKTLNYIKKNCRP